MKGLESKSAPIPALEPRGKGHQFVLYGDSCSGVPGAPHEQTFAAVNRVVSRLAPEPDFILFPGDEVIGLTTDPDRLRAQWRHWLEVEMGWLDATLRQHGDAKYKFVVGHHPVFPINGFSGDYQREIGPEHGPAFWARLVKRQVFAYLCSHILAFDVQVHQGVLQIASAGAGTAHRMPEEDEYLHAVQAALDVEGLRYQVLDTDGRVRERLAWPFALPEESDWSPLTAENRQDAAIAGNDITASRLQGLTTPAAGAPQTLIAGCGPESSLDPLWIGLTGRDNRLTVSLSPMPGRSPHSWFGPCLEPDRAFDLQLALHRDMGPGGVLFRSNTDGGWTTLRGASAWGPERLDWPNSWTVGHGTGGPQDRPFAGSQLDIRTAFAAA